MKIAKEFRWEMGHRLPFHLDKCRNLHGHSYKMLLELEGDVDSNGMVLDYYDLKNVIGPVVEELDHAFMVNKNDTDLIDMLVKMNSKHVAVNFESTAENICVYMLDKIRERKLPSNIRRVMVKIYETETTYAEAEIPV